MTSLPPPSVFPRLHLTSTIALSILVATASIGLLIYYPSITKPAWSKRSVKKQETRRESKTCCGGDSTGCCNDETTEAVISLPVQIYYGSQTGTAKRFAESFQKAVFALNVSGFHLLPSVASLGGVELDALEKGGLFIFILSTYTDGVPAVPARHFFTLVDDYAKDFRVSKDHLQKVKFAVFGLGSSVYETNFAKAGKTLDENLRELGAKSMVGVGVGDDTVDIAKQFEEWKDKLIPLLCEEYMNGRNAAAAGCGTCGTEVDELKVVKSWEEGEVKVYKKRTKRFGNMKRSETDVTLTEEDLLNEALVESDSEEEEDGKERKKESSLMDLEDLGSQLKPQEAETKVMDREMVTPMQRKALIKEGYKIIGTHSAVKLCRWTKAQLRGRGGCYKHTFYGINSYQCMETTPSLACANKCVFCWRHHKNPVGREWRWKIDDPHMIVEESIEKHRRMINEFKGAPGVKPERLEEAFTVKHCALSLVGEPIMYPYINEFLRDLHGRGISSFMVTNAQFPEKIVELEPVTQLYVSIDASTKETLKAIDRPLFKDFWERFTGSLKALKDKRQRTVYRLTLVKEYNMTEVTNYCDLIALGEPDLIEIKAVTYCGKSDASPLTMKHVPWHVEVREFSKAICEKLNGEYELACEHAHSCCVLLARKKFKVDGRWHTWIDYERYHKLTQRFYETGEGFAAEDYWAETPEWAVFGATEEGFDPVDSRYRKNRDGKIVAIDYKSSESGCG